MSNIFEYEMMEIYGTGVDDIDQKSFASYFKREFGQSYEEKGLTFEEALKAKRVLRNGQLSLAGLLFFGKNPQNLLTSEAQYQNCSINQ